MVYDSYSADIGVQSGINQINAQNVCKHDANSNLKKLMSWDITVLRLQIIERNCGFFLKMSRALQLRAVKTVLCWKVTKFPFLKVFTLMSPKTGHLFTLTL